MLVPNTFVAALALLAAPVAGLSSAAISRFQATDLGTHRNASVPKLVHAAAITGGLLWTVYDDESLPMLNVTEAEGSNNTLERRCGSNNVICDYANYRANSPLCGILVSYFAEPDAVNWWATSFTAQCMTAEELPSPEDRCCVSWPYRVTGLKVSMLWGAAAPSRAKCTRDVLVSARATDVDLAGACTVQCMSNRPDGCY